MRNPVSEELIFLIVIIGLLFTPAVFFLITLQNTLKAVDADKRKMKPIYVWLLLMPVYNLYWIFIVTGAVSNSCKAQLEKYGDHSIADQIYNLGTGFAIFTLCDFIPFIGIVLSLPTLLFFVLFWIKVNQTKKRILMFKRTFANRDENSIFK